MDTLGNLMYGFSECLSFLNIFMIFVGGLMGIFVGAMPGLGSVAGVALLLPLTFNMNPNTAIITLAAVYYGNMFGGSISAIFLNIPGDSPMIMTALDGNKMCKQGKAGKALFVAFFSSFIGGLIGAVLLTFLGPALAMFGLKFGPPEYATLILLALSSIGWVLGDSPVEGLIAAFIGLMVASIGLDNMTGSSRFTFGSINMLAGIPFIPALIGLFGFSQVIENYSHETKSFDSIKIGKVSFRQSIPDLKEWLALKWTILRSSFLGFFIGILPGSGATTAAFLSYITEKRLSKFPEKLGEGAPEGVAAAEAANNAGSIGSFAPLLALGIPGSGTAAVLLGGLMMWGLQPGPLLFVNEPDFVWTLIGSIFIGDILILLLVILMIPFLVNILKVPQSILFPIIIVICIVGSYSVNNSLFDVYVMIMAGVVGFWFNKLNIPLAPLALAFVLGPTLETSIRQSLIASNGSLLIFFTRPIALGFLMAIFVLIILPSVFNKVKKRII